MGVNTQFSQTVVGATGGTFGDSLRIAGNNYHVISVNSDTSLTIDPIPSESVSEDNFYLEDFLGYNLPLMSIDVESESLVAEFQGATGNFFMYNVIYGQDVPLINKVRSQTVSLPDDNSLALDYTTGRLIVSQANNLVNPIFINLGFSSPVEGVFEEMMTLSLNKTKLFNIDAVPSLNSDGSWTVRIPYLGYGPEFESFVDISLSRGYTGGYQNFPVSIVSVTEESGSTFLVLNETSSTIFSTVGSGNLSNFKITLNWNEPLLTLNLYAEAESEDERLRLTLENFGRKIDLDKEYIFRDSDIKEGLTDFQLLNKKRKELLLEGDSIYPYLGSYKSLINVLNFFGYYDVEIKEYFMLVDQASPDFGKLMAVPIAKSSSQSDLVKKVWNLVPSKIYKKTSMFGLFYNLNVESGEFDEFGIPIVVDDFTFSPEEVLIKLFGLKQLLMDEYLPTNARIKDITGDGIYFQRVNFETWTDIVNVTVLEIGTRPTVEVFPNVSSYIRDLRRMDKFYVDKFTRLGYSGFLGDVTSQPGFTVLDNTLADMDPDYVDSTYIPAYSIASISELFPSYVGSFNDYNAFMKWEHRDETWDSMPPGIYDANFNVNASYYKPLPDDPTGTFPTGAPALIETLFALLWNNCDFSWDQVSTLTSFPATYNASGATVTISDMMEISILKRGFTDGDSVTIANSPFDGTYNVQGSTGSSFQISVGTSPTLQLGTLTYSIDVAQISETVNRLSWDTIGRGEYIDMRIVVEMYGTDSFLYDSGRKPIDEFNVPYFDPTVGLTYNRILDAVVLPREGTYGVGVYIYDITNNFTMQFQEYNAITPTAEITASYQAQDDFQTWSDLTMVWNDVAFDWYYPSQTSSSWENADLQWDSLEAYSYMNQSLKEDQVLFDNILEINREKEYVKIAGSYNGSGFAVPGDFLYLENNSSSLKVTSYEMTVGSISILTSTTVSALYPNNDIPLQARILVKKFNVPYDQLVPGDFFYADVVQLLPGRIVFSADAYTVATFSSYWINSSVFIDAGVYVGRYAIEILTVKDSGEDTIFYLKDTLKELYKLDGYFSPFLTTYDVNYAEAHLGNPANDYENVSDVNWNDFSGNAWWAEERHPSANSGFVMTSISSNGKITVGDHETFIFSGDGALNMPEGLGFAYACRELNESTNEGIAKYEYELYPSWIFSTTDYLGNYIRVKYDVAIGSTSVELTGTPFNVKATAKVQLGLSGDHLTASLVESGSGYTTPPSFHIEGPSAGTTASISLIVDEFGKVSSLMVNNSGSGYTSIPNYSIDPPENSEEWMTNMVWTGNEWHKVVGVNVNSIILDSPTTQAINRNYELHLPYRYHTQIFSMNPRMLKDFYFFILAKAKTPGLNSLDVVTFDRGVEGEWLNDPKSTYSFPLKNDILFRIGGFDLSEDVHYQYWENNGEAFPVKGQSADYSKSLYAGAYHEPFSFSDAVITPESFQIGRSTSVVFHDDSTRLPIKTNRTWKIIDESTGDTVVESTSDKLLWNFSTIGNFSVALDVADKLGNVSSGIKKSFVTVV